MERFLSWILADKNFDRTGLSSILNTLDKKLSVADPDAVRVAGMLQKYRGETDMLIVSAHIHLLTVLDGKGTRGDMVRTLKDLVSQGVPSMRNHAYGEELAKKLMDPRTPYEAVETVVTEGIKLSFYADLFAREAMKYAGTKHNEVAVALFEIGAKTASGDLFDGLVKACGSIKQFDKAMEAIRADLRAKGARQLFAEVEAQARTIHDQNKETSFFKRLFCRKSRDDEFSNRG